MTCSKDSPIKADITTRLQILIIDDDQTLSECMTYALSEYNVDTCTNAIDAMNIIDANLPSLIILDILLDGPDGFSLLNEIISYDDTMCIPVIIISSLDLSHQNLSHYGVVKILQKETMTPQNLSEAVRTALERQKLMELTKNA